MYALRHSVVVLLVLAFSASGLPAQSGVQPPVTNLKIEEAIGRACQTLKELQGEDGAWDDYAGYPGATTALAVQALLLAGEPHDSPVIQKASVALTRFRIEKTYTVACRAMAYALLSRHYPQLRPKLAADASWLSRNQHGDGMWGYNVRKENKDRADNSNTQFAVLGLRDASMAGIEISQSTWGRLLKHYQKTQLPDGGWTYRAPDPKQDNLKELVASVSVTAPSLASLMIVNDELLKTSGCPCSGGRSSGSRVEEKHVKSGVQWLVGFFDGNIQGAGGGGQWQTYFYYGLQRAGQASGLKTFGRHDWYKRGSAAMTGQTRTSCLMKYIPNLHDPDSDLNKNRKDFRPPRVIVQTEKGKEQKYVTNTGALVDVSLAVIFLVKGNAPVYMNKLSYDGDWNRHRRDLALATEEVAKRLERPFRWQVVDIRSDPADWAKDSPLLYMSGEDELKLTDEDKSNLKTFCNNGGVLLVEANCGNGAFGTQARAVIKELWPEWPLETLPQTHAIYDCQLKIDAEALFEGVDDGIRTFVLLTDRDFSCAWQMRHIVKEKPKFDMAVNLYAYATDKAPPPAKLVEIERRAEERRQAMEAWLKAVAEERALARKEKRRARRIPKPKRASSEDLEVDIRMVTPGEKKLVTVNLLKHEGDYTLGLHYQILGMLIAEFQKTIGVTLAMGSALGPDEIDPGMPDVLIVRGDKPMGLTDAQKASLAGYMKRGGFVIAEAAMGRKPFDDDFRKFITETEGLTLVPLGTDDPLLTGEIDEGLEGLDATTCTFSRTVREENPGIKTPVVLAIKAGDRLAGYYSPYDLTYSSTGCVAYGLRGYDRNSALAILINMFLKPTKG